MHDHVIRVFFQKVIANRIPDDILNNPQLQLALQVVTVIDHQSTNYRAHQIKID